MGCNLCGASNGAHHFRHCRLLLDEFGHLLLQLGTQRNTAALGSAARLVLSVMRSRFIALTVCRKALRSQPRRPIKRRFRIP
jgi:hypothetical protein